MNLRSIAAVLLLSLLSTSITFASPEQAKSARLMWSAFECGMYAEMAGDAKEQARLFDVGIKAGHQFLNAVRSNQISEQDFRENVPLGVSMMLQGPSDDFIIGRIFGDVGKFAYDKVAKRGETDPSKWLNDDLAIKSGARLQYQQANCAIIQ